MNFEDIESECLSSDVFSVAQNTCKSEFSQCPRHRDRRSPRRKLKMTQTSALVIDQLKSDFPHPAFRGDYAPPVRTRRDWRPEFLMKYLRGNRRAYNEEYAAVQRGGSCPTNLVAEVPRIYSIGLRSGAKSATDVDDPRVNSCTATRECRKRLGIVRRAMIVCKYWIAQSTAASYLSTAVPAKEYEKRRTMVFDRTESADLPKFDQKRNRSRDDRSCERAEEKQRKRSNDVTAAALRDDCAAGDRSFTPDVTDLPLKKDYKEMIANASRVMKKDAQIQTSNRKTWKRAKSRSNMTNETIVDGQPIHESTGMNRSNESRLSIRVLESKRAEYVKKFTAVNRRIEEITAALRETCYGDESPRNNAKNYEKDFSSMRNDTEATKIKRELDNVDDNFAICTKNRRKRKSDAVNVKRIAGKSESDRSRKSVRKILQVNNNYLDNETAVSLRKSPKDISASSTSPDDSLNANARDSVQMIAIKGTSRPTEEIDENRKGTKHRAVEQISVDLDLTRRDDEIWEFSIENDEFDEVGARNNFALTNDVKNARVLIEDSIDLEKSGDYKKFVEGKGELTVLEDIKRRIDRDFDSPSIKSVSDAEDLLAISRGSCSFESNDRSYQPVMVERATESTATFEESTSLILYNSSYSDALSEIQIRDSASTGAMSEHSNKTSTLSKYYSCTQFPSLISLREEEPVHEDQHAIARPDSYSDLRSSTDYYDLNTNSYIDRSQSDLNLNCNSPRLNLSSHFARSRINIAQHSWSNKFLTGTIDEWNGSLESPVDREAESKIGQRECPLSESDEKTKESRVDFMKYCTPDCTLETSKSSRYIGSIDSGVFFSSSLMDLCSRETSFDGGAKPSLRRRKQRRAKKRNESLSIIDFSSNSSCNDDTHDQRVDNVVRDLTKNLIVCERRAKTKLREMRWALIREKNARYSRHTSSMRTCKFSKNLDAYCTFFTSPRRCNEDERVVSISTPSLLSLSNSEVEERESSCQPNNHTIQFL